MHHSVPQRLLHSATARSARAPHGNHLREAAGLKHGGHEEDVAAGIDQVTQRLIVGKPQAGSVRVLPPQVIGQGIEFTLQLISTSVYQVSSWRAALAHSLLPERHVLHHFVTAQGMATVRADMSPACSLANMQTCQIHLSSSCTTLNLVLMTMNAINSVTGAAISKA